MIVLFLVCCAVIGAIYGLALWATLRAAARQDDADERERGTRRS